MAAELKPSCDWHRISPGECRFVSKNGLAKFATDVVRLMW